MACLRLSSSSPSGSLSKQEKKVMTWSVVGTSHEGQLGYPAIRSSLLPRALTLAWPSGKTSLPPNTMSNRNLAYAAPADLHSQIIIRRSGARHPALPFHPPRCSQSFLVSRACNFLRPACSCSLPPPPPLLVSLFPPNTPCWPVQWRAPPMRLLL